jgi:hypothetical protein
MGAKIGARKPKPTGIAFLVGGGGEIVHPHLMSEAFFSLGANEASAMLSDDVMKFLFVSQNNFDQLRQLHKDVNREGARIMVPIGQNQHGDVVQIPLSLENIIKYDNLRGLKAAILGTAHERASLGEKFDFLIASLDNHNDPSASKHGKAKKAKKGKKGKKTPKRGAKRAKRDVGKSGRKFRFGETAAPVSALVPTIRQVCKELHVKGGLVFSHMCGSNATAKVLAEKLPKFLSFGFGPDNLYATKQIKAYASVLRRGSKARKNGRKAKLSVSSVSVRRLGRAVFKTFRKVDRKRKTRSTKAGVGRVAVRTHWEMLGHEIARQECVDGKSLLCKGSDSDFANHLGLGDVFKRFRREDPQYLIYSVAGGHDDATKAVSEEGQGAETETESESSAAVAEEPDWMPAYWRQAKAGNYVYRRAGITPRFQEMISISVGTVQGRARREKAAEAEKKFNKKFGEIPKDTLLVGFSRMMENITVDQLSSYLADYASLLGGSEAGEEYAGSGGSEGEI